MESTSYFANSHGLLIGNDGNFATVHGNQILNYFNREPERKTALTIYDQVMLGDIYRTKDLGVSTYPRRGEVGYRKWREKGKPRSDRTICAAQVIGVEGRAFTMVSYKGPEAREAFENDFQMYARTLTAGPFQVYGINTNIPTILFYDERQPLAKFVNGLGFFGKFYLQSLKKQLNWHKNEIWLDPKNGQLCQGPAGPECYTISRSYIPWKDLPCSAELLQEGNCLPFLAGLEAKSRVDREVVKVIAGEFNWGDPEAEVHQPTILSTLTNATVAVSGGLWRQDLVGDCLGAREVMENGMTRFTLEEGDRLSVWIDWVEERRGWISQATSVFHRCGVSLTDDLSQYELLRPDLSLAGDLSDSEATRQRRWEKPIYLFVGSLSPSTPTEDCTTSSLHHWSFDPTGQHPLPAETCEHLGLPIELSLDVSIPYRCRWNKEAYKWMHQYQLARGFDPKTTDFARHLGYLIYQVQSDSDRSEDVDAQSSPVVSTSKTTSTSPDLHMPSRTPGNAASRLPTKSTPSVSIFPPNQPQIQPRESTRVHRTVTRDAAKPGMTSGKASPDSLRTRTPLTSEPIHIASSSPELRTPKRDAMTSASSRSAKPSSSVVRISRPQAGPNLALNAGTSRNGSGMGGDEQTKTPCKGARQRRDPGSIPTPTRPINVHERSSSMRVWK